jgi:hypothetical protein
VSAWPDARIRQPHEGKDVPGTNRGAIPLAVLVTASLAAGIVAAVDRINEQEERPRAQPPPAVPASPSPAQPTDQPTEPGLTPETPEPETPEPTEEPTAEPTKEPKTPEPDATPLARTGGPTLPFYGMGLILMAASGLLWRFSRSR